MCNGVGRYQTLLCLFISVYEISIVYIQECKLVKKYVYFFFTCDQLIELSVHLKICILIKIFNKKFI